MCEQVVQLLPHLVVRCKVRSFTRFRMVVLWWSVRSNNETKETEQTKGTSLPARQRTGHCVDLFVEGAQHVLTVRQHGGRAHARLRQCRPPRCRHLSHCLLQTPHARILLCAGKSCMKWAGKGEIACC